MYANENRNEKQNNKLGKWKTFGKNFLQMKQMSYNRKKKNKEKNKKTVKLRLSYFIQVYCVSLSSSSYIDDPKASDWSKLPEYNSCRKSSFSSDNNGKHSITIAYPYRFIDSR